jgi:hypothetical protein
MLFTNLLNPRVFNRVGSVLLPLGGQVLLIERREIAKVMFGMESKKSGF